MFHDALVPFAERRIIIMKVRDVKNGRQVAMIVNVKVNIR